MIDARYGFGLLRMGVEGAMDAGRLAKLLEMPLAELEKKLEDEDKTFVWLKRQVDDAVAQQITALDIKGIYQRKEYKRQYPEGESAAHVVGFTGIEDNASLPYASTLCGACYDVWRVLPGSGDGPRSASVRAEMLLDTHDKHLPKRHPRREAGPQSPRPRLHRGGSAAVATTESS